MIARSAAEPEDTRCRVAALRARRQRADFDEAEAYGEELARHTRILVEAGRHAQRVGKIEAQDALCQALVVGPCGAGIKAELERFDGEVVSALRIERLEQSLAQAEQRVHARTRAGRRWRPSGPSLSGSSQAALGGRADRKGGETAPRRATAPIANARRGFRYASPIKRGHPARHSAWRASLPADRQTRDE